MSESDAIVIGGGPAGTATARLLAVWGHSVLLLTKSIDRTRGLAESLPPSTRKLLATVGVLDELERAGFYRTTGNTVWWASRERRVETFEPSGEASGFQVFRPDLDQLLRDNAARAGVRVLDDAQVRQVELGADAETDASAGSAGEPLAVVHYTHAGRPERAACRFVLDASGRAGVIARRGFRRHEPGGRMQAFIGIWERAAGWDLPDETQTLVETYADGWSWSVPISRSTRHIAAMLDATTTELTRGETLAETYRTELAKTHALRQLMTDATLQHVWACDASLYDATTYAGPRFLLVGDAGSFIDPLSSFGVKKALASAWLAAIAVHTSLIAPDRAVVAREFFSQWERQMYAGHLRRTREFARGAYAQHPHPFWAARAEKSAIDADDDVDEAALLGAPAVRAAFETVRQSAAIDLAWASHLQFELRPMIRDREIVLDQAVPLPAAGTARRFVGGIDLVQLGDLASQHRQVGDLYDAYCRTCAPVSLPGFLGGLSLLVAHGALTSRAR